MSSITQRFEITCSPKRELWEQFVTEHPHGGIFQHPAFMELYNAASADSATVLAALDENNTIVGILVYITIKESGIGKIFSTRSIIQGGPLVQNGSATILECLISAYERSIVGKGVIYTEIRNHHDTASEKQLLKTRGYFFTDHLNIYIDLSVSEDGLMQEMHKKRLSNIRRSIRKGVFSRELIYDSEIDEAYNLIKKTYQRVNLPAPPAELFLKTRTYLKDKVRMYGAFSDGRMIGVRVYLFYGRTIYDWYAGSDENYFHLHPNDILPWDMMKRGKAENFLVYDFGGAGNPAKEYGVRTYKERFGGKAINRGRYKKVHRPFLHRIGTLAIKYYKYLR